MKRATGSNRYAEPLPTDGFKGGEFGGAGYGTEFGENIPIQVDSTQYIKRTPIPGQESFSQAFKRARDNGDDTFIFNGKEFTTEISDNPQYVGKRYQPTIDGVIREVLDKDMNSITDSLRIEPYIGQILGIYKK